MVKSDTTPGLIVAWTKFMALVIRRVGGASKKVKVLGITDLGNGHVGIQLEKEDSGRYFRVPDGVTELDAVRALTAMFEALGMREKAKLDPDEYLPEP